VAALITILLIGVVLDVRTGGAATYDLTDFRVRNVGPVRGVGRRLDRAAAQPPTRTSAAHRTGRGGPSDARCLPSLAGRLREHQPASVTSAGGHEDLGVALGVQALAGMTQSFARWRFRSDASLRGTYAEDCHETTHIPLLSSCTAKSTIVVVPSA
jgi:hypothetical protein